MRSSQLVLIIPFENTSNAAALDWISESFPEVLSTRLNASGLYVMSRNDRISAFDHLGIPASARPSRATIYQIAQQLDADYVIMGDYQVSNSNVTTHARLIDMARLRLSADLTEAGPLANLVAIQTDLAWDILNALDSPGKPPKTEFASRFKGFGIEALENYILGITAADGQEKIRKFKEVVRLEPSHSMAILQLGKSYYNLRDYESAMTWLAKVPASSPGGNEAHFYFGLAAYYSGHLNSAEAAFRSLAFQLPLTEVYNNLGVISARRGNRAAHDYFEKSVQTDPNDPDYRFNFAVQLAREGDVRGAENELREMLAIHSDPEAKAFLDALNSGTAPARLPPQRIKRNYDESSFRQLALEIASANEMRLKTLNATDHAAFHVQRGQELLESGLLGEAEKEFREAAVLDPDSAAAHSGLAHVLESSQDSDGARNEARVSLKLKPSVEAYLVLARLDLTENKSASAVQDVEQALALDPSNAAAAALKREIASGLAGKPPSPQP